MFDHLVHRSRALAWGVLRGGLVLVFLVALAACGSAGSGGEDDQGKYPSPPDRPGVSKTVEADSTR